MKEQVFFLQNSANPQSNISKTPDLKLFSFIKPEARQETSVLEHGAVSCLIPDNPTVFFVYFEMIK